MKQINEHEWTCLKHFNFLHSEWFGLGHYPLLSFFGGGNACRLTFPLQTSRTKNSEAPISRCLVLFICLKFGVVVFLFFPSLFYFSNGFPSMLQSFWRIYVGIVLLGSICGRCEFEDQNRINKVSMWFCVKSCVSVCYKLENVVVFVISFQKNGRVFPIKTFDLFEHAFCILSPRPDELPTTRYPSITNDSMGRVPSSSFPLYVSARKNNNIIYTLWLFNIAMENCPFIDCFSIKNGDFPWLC